MRTLEQDELNEVAGGFSVLGVTEIGLGLKVMGQVQAIAGAAIASFSAGYAVGSAIYAGYEWIAGDSLGGDIYDVFHSGGC